jgi:hypothetical protein
METSQSFSGGQQYNFIEGNVTILSCTFLNLNPGEAASLTFLRASFYLMNSTIINCSQFIDLQYPVNSSSVSFCWFEDPLSQPNLAIIRVRYGSFKLVDTVFHTTNFTTDSNATFINISDCISVIFDSVSFDRPAGSPGTFALFAQNTADIRIANSNFNTGNSPAGSLSDSYAMADSSCFTGMPIFQTDLNSFFSLHNTIIQSNLTCPSFEISATLSAEKEAYAIATVVIFFLCFAVLFIGLIIFVFCKARSAGAPEYAELQEEAEEQDDDDVDIPSD